jgi:hypothetical protein
MGKQISKEEREIEAGLNRFHVPVSGLVEIKVSE